MGDLTGAVQAVAFSPDGRTLAAAWGYAGKETGAVIAVFEIPSGNKVWESAERGLNILSLAYSPDGRTIAAAAGRSTSYTAIGYARLRDAATGTALGEPIVGGPGGVLSVAFSPDGRQLALASRGAVDIYDLSSESRPIVHQLRGHVNFVYAVAFSPDGQRVATGGWDKTIRLWDRATGAPAANLDRPSRVRPRPGVFTRRFSSGLRQRGQERAAMGPDRRRGKRRVSRPHRLCPLRGFQPDGASWPRRGAWTGPSSSGRRRRRIPR